VDSAATPTVDAPPALRVAAWTAIPGLEHGFFGRAGGASAGDFRSLNVSDRVGDDPTSVATNWNHVGRALSGLSIVRMRQVHGRRVLRIDGVQSPAGEADGMVAGDSGLGLAVLTADCVPILCVAPAARAVMALHAGWRGTLAGIVGAGLAEARSWLGVAPDAWYVAMGPSIGGCCYEVEATIGQQFVDRWGAMPDAWQPAGAHGQLDLRAANRQILLEHGVAAARIATIGPCTACAHEAYFSHRQSAGRAGRQVSVIGWAD
jgi:YfiH family protein